jgi:hypothetical protein
MKIKDILVESGSNLPSAPSLNDVSATNSKTKISKNTNKEDLSFDQIYSIIQRNPVRLVKYIDDIADSEVDDDVIVRLFTDVLEDIDDDNLEKVFYAINSRYSLELMDSSIYDPILERDPSWINALIPIDHRYHSKIGEKLNEYPEVIEHLGSNHYEVLWYVEPEQSGYIKDLIYSNTGMEINESIAQDILSYLNDQTLYQVVDDLNDTPGMELVIARCIPEDRWTNELVEYLLRGSRLRALEIFYWIPIKFVTTEMFKDVLLKEMIDYYVVGSSITAGVLRDVIFIGNITTDMLKDPEIVNAMRWIFKTDEDKELQKEGIAWLKKHTPADVMKSATKMPNPYDKDLPPKKSSATKLTQQEIEKMWAGMQKTLKDML